MNNVVIVDYGMSNLRSVQRGFEKVGAKVTLSSNYSDVATADRLVLPGVGAFESGMNGLKDLNLVEAIHDFVKTGNSLLGICLGMQMFLDYSEENGNHKGLGLISGGVKKIPVGDSKENSRKIPHIGWAALQKPQKIHWNDSCLEKIQTGGFFYFVHSYMAVTENKEDLLAQCEDEGLLVAAAIKKDNVTGLQFHPEKSGEIGLRVLNKFISL
jgi:imidazole glycerol-phosphate synthase subunit HisH